MSQDSKDTGKPQRQTLTQLVSDIDDVVQEEYAHLDADALRNKAASALEEYDYEMARALYKLAVWRSDGDAEAVCDLARFLVEDYAIFDEAIAFLTAPDCKLDATGRNLLANAYFLAGRKEEALNAYLELTRQGSGDATAYKRAGRLLLDMGRAEEALASLDKATQFDTADIEAGKWKKEAMALAEARFEPTLNSVQGALDQGALDRAETLLNELHGDGWRPPRFYHMKNELENRRASSQVETLRSRACDLALEEDLDEALGLYQEILRIDSEDSGARARVDELQVQIAHREATKLMGEALELLERGEQLPGAMRYVAALEKSRQIAAAGKERAPIFGAICEFVDVEQELPAQEQTSALVSLLEVDSMVAQGALSGAGKILERCRKVLPSMPSLETARQAFKRAERTHRYAQAEEAFRNAAAAHEEGDDERAAELFESAASVEGFPLAQEARRRMESLKKQSQLEREIANLQKWVGSLLEESQYFPALRELEKRRNDLEKEPFFVELEGRARDGVQQKFPVTVRPITDTLDGPTTNYDSYSHGVEGFDADKTRFATLGPEGERSFVFHGDTMLVLNTRSLTAEAVVTLPEQANLLEKKGFILVDIAPGERESILIANWDDDLLLKGGYRRRQFHLENVLHLEEGILPQTRQKTTRWFAPNGPEERLIVCESAPGTSSKTRLYSLSLSTGKLLLEENYGYALSNLRRLPRSSDKYVVHRHPEPYQMRKSGYFSFGFMDARMRVTDRFNIKPQELDGTLVESTRWMRFGHEGKRLHFLFRYFDGYSGQLVARPFAFVTMEASGELVFAAADSSVLLQSEGDLEPMGELIRYQDADYAVMLARKGDLPFVTVINLDKFKTVQRMDCPEDERMLQIAPGQEPGQWVSVSIDKGNGRVRMRRHTIEV